MDERMSPTELLQSLRARGVEVQLSPDGRRALARGASKDDISVIRREKLWLLMLLTHEAGGDLYDPRLAFVGSAERGLTRGAIRTRMETAFDIEPSLASALIELAETAGYLRRRGELLEPVGDVAAVLGRERELLHA